MGLFSINYTAQFLVKLKASLGGSYARFEAMSGLDKSSFVLGNELWEEHFESLLALVKAYIIDIWEERNMVMLSVLNNPILTLQLGILGKLLWLMGRIVKGCVREVSLAQVSCILMLRQHQWVRGRWPWGYGSVLSIIITQIVTSRNIPRAQLYDATQTRPSPVYREGVATPD